MYFEIQSVKWPISECLKCAKTSPNYKSLFVVCRVEYHWYDIKNVSLVQNSAQPYQCIWPIPCWTWDQVSLYAFDPPFFNTTIWLINFAVTKINSDEKEENSSICCIYKAWKKYHTTKFRKIIFKERLKRNLGETAAQVNIQPAMHIEGRAWLQ